jgi:hypothetical protein
MDTSPVELVTLAGAQAATLRLSGSVDVTVACQLLDAARLAAATEGDVIVLAGNAERFDLSALQILVALKRAMPLPRRCLFGSLSAAGRRFIDLSGLGGELPPAPETPTQTAEEKASS